jgi:RNA recognition motif-containing protein
MNNENIEIQDFLLDTLMFPSGSWLINLPYKQLSDNVVSTLKPFEISKLSHDEVNSLKTAKGLGISESSVMLYNVPKTVGLDEMYYAFEDFKISKSGIQKINSTSTDNRTSSYLIHFENTSEAQRALIQKNGLAFAGNVLHMLWYNMMHIR